MKIKAGKTSVFILVFVFLFIICIGGIIGFNIWRNNMAFTLDSEAQYTIGEADFTSIVNYRSITDAFSLAFIFTLFGMFFGIAVDTLILFVFIVIHLIVDNRDFIEEKREENRKFNEERKRKIEEHDRQIHEYAEEQRKNSRKKTKPLSEAKLRN